ncbi:hypothetical protein RJ640_020500 [Escallonia rubra]|uniref:Reverse transcriptase Ty1/copia-type domain-containing protein n=1 Tax=Escallonia rubra TaxID=112253 RepID=A0AA88UFP8_9ASTE|nr:hypothetical protein RJ640_020500 [Escallonia rubra]
MSMMGELTFFLGLQIKQSKDGIFINQAKYTKELLKRFDMEASNAFDTPMSSSLKLDKDEKGKDVDIKRYRVSTSRHSVEPQVLFVLSISEEVSGMPTLVGLGTILKKPLPGVDVVRSGVAGDTFNKTQLEEDFHESSTARSNVLGMLCGIYQKLENAEFKYVTLVELKSMLGVVQDLESARLEVSWLREILDEVCKALRLSKGYPKLKVALASNCQEIEIKKKELDINGQAKMEKVSLQQKQVSTKRERESYKC